MNERVSECDGRGARTAECCGCCGPGETLGDRGAGAAMQVVFTGNECLRIRIQES